jgi:UDP:flavonoid glycosyltransferase YjiC (YdhE family)
MGEARYFGKRMLVVPMPNQHEQEINARYARLGGIGDYCSIADLTGDRIIKSLKQPVANGQGANGVDQVLDLLGIGYG